jgi:hypothetical protein
VLAHTVFDHHRIEDDDMVTAVVGEGVALPAVDRPQRDLPGIGRVMGRVLVDVAGRHAEEADRHLRDLVAAGALGLELVADFRRLREGDARRHLPLHTPAATVPGDSAGADFLSDHRSRFA